MSQKKVFVFSHTHWDREWYKTFQEFRFDVVEVVDQVLNLLQAGEYDYFILDGQTVILDDYLEVRPANLKEKLAGWVKKGKMVIGPWYILPDEFLVSGESLIRNLMIGKQTAEDYGRMQPIGYLPDMFGHIAQIPQLLKGFGIDKAVVWRGAAPQKSIFLWEGLDKTKILAAHLTDGYYNTYLINYQNQKKDFPALMKKLDDNSYGDIILFPNGADHLAPVEEIKDLLHRLNTEYPAYKFVQSTLEGYFNNLKVNEKELEVISGELRTLVPRAYILPGVFSARMYLKQRNHYLQSLITDWVEPLATISWILGNDYKQGFVDLAWKYLLLNQPHDSICGCSTDPVHKEMLHRYDSAEEICEKLINRAMKSIANSLISDKEHDYLLIFNMSNWFYSGVEEFVLDFPQEEKVESFILRDTSGNKISYEILEKTDTRKFVSETDVLPDWVEITRYRIQAYIKDVLPLGYKFIEIVTNAENETLQQKQVKISKTGLENKFLRLSLENKNLKLKNLVNNEEFIINTFESSGDAGDEYNYSPPLNDTVSKAVIISTEIENESRLAATLKVIYSLDIPESIEENRKDRSDDLISHEIVSYITMKADDPVLYFKTIIDNQSKDHRLRVNFSSNVLSGNDNLKCLHDAQFGIMERPAVPNTRGYDVEKYDERTEETFTIQSFAALEEGNSGISLFSKGLPEVEITSVNNRINMSLTLLRCVGWLSRDDFRTRGGGAGPMFPTPDAQCLGISIFEYSLYPYSTAFNESETVKKASQYIRGTKYIEHKPGEKTLMALEDSLLGLEPETLAMSCLKRSQKQDGVIFRFFNPMPYEQTFSIRPADNFSFKEVSLVRLDEEYIRELPKSHDGAYTGNIKPYEIITLEFVTVDFS